MIDLTRNAHSAIVLAGSLFVGLLTSFSCSDDEFRTCQESRNCPDSDAGSDAASDAGDEAPCNGACAGETPICNASNNTCVGCIANGDCTTDRPFCQTSTSECVECLTTMDCNDPTMSSCSAGACQPCMSNDGCAHIAGRNVCGAGQCVQCANATDCQDPKASACAAGECKACTRDDECAHISGKGVCSAGECVECTGKFFTPCGTEGGSQRVCDSLTQTCSAHKQQTAGPCQPCVSDAHCAAGQLCVLQKFGNPEQEVGYFCHWKEGDTNTGSCLSTRPYVRTMYSATSVDGAMADVCGLGASTCIAMNDISKSCAPEATPNDGLCGFDPPNDAICDPNGECQMRCSYIDDCPTGTFCDESEPTRAFCSTSGG